MLIKMGLILSVIILQRVVESTPIRKAVIYRPVWPPGLTYLTDSTASFTWMDKQEPWKSPFPESIRKATSFSTQFEKPPSLFDNIDQSTYPEIANVLDIIYQARATATHENFDIGLKHAISHIYKMMLQVDENSITECYTYIWAFLAEHGRHLTDLSLKVQEVHLTPEQHLKVRALEALRAGIERFFQSRYPDLCGRLACSNVHDPEKQLNAMEELIKSEHETAIANRKQRMAMFNDWHQILRENNIAHPNTSVKFSKHPSPALIIDAMRNVMQTVNCPWWHAPLNYIQDTHVSKRLCAMWQYSGAQMADKTILMSEEENMRASTNVGLKVSNVSLT